MTPLFATLKGFVVAVVLAVILGHAYGAGGIAASIALGAWSSATSLIRHGAVEFGFAIDASARRRLPRIVLSALAMGALLWLAAPLMLASGANPHGLVQGVLVALLIAGGIAIYGLFLGFFGVIRRAEVVNAIRQSSDSGLRD